MKDKKKFNLRNNDFSNNYFKCCYNVNALYVIDQH